jgi:4-diphosphocytidyl-2-C-methyl-D-erythritol kinase
VTAAETHSAVEIVDTAPAKVNLTLRVLGRRADGYHEIESLVAFADLCDRLSYAPDNQLKLNVTGPRHPRRFPSFVQHPRNSLAGLLG